MSDYGRYRSDQAVRERDRDFARDRDFEGRRFESGYDRPRGSIFDRDEDRRGRGDFFGRDRDENRERGGFFGGGRSRRDEELELRDRDRLDRDDERHRFKGSSRSSAYGRRSRYGRDFDRDQAYYGYDDYHEGLPIDETSRLIASNKVEGTPVYGRDGDRLGTIYNFMVDKRSGQVEYAVMTYGGFLGMGQRYYPLPWRMLTYDTREGGYRIDMSERDLERAPSFTRDDEPRFNREYGRRVHDYYGLDY